jgi:hypothetical protein
LYRKGLTIKIRNVLATGYAHLLAIKILQKDKFSGSDSALYRDTAQVPSGQLCLSG